MSKAKNQETTVETKNTEVKANLNGQEVILIIPVAKSGYQGLQSTKSKNKDKITSRFERNEVEKGEEEIKKISLRSILNWRKRFLLICLRDLKDLSLSLKPIPSCLFDRGSHGERRLLST